LTPIIGQLDFGKHIKDNSYLSEILETLPKLKGDDPATVLKDVYEMRFGICDHLDPEVKKNRAFASIAKHPVEDLARLKSESDIRKYYMEKNVHKHTGISYTEFMGMTNVEMQEVMDHITKVIIREAELAKQLGKA
jgi:hypothetical protein